MAGRLPATLEQGLLQIEAGGKYWTNVGTNRNTPLERGSRYPFAIITIGTTETAASFKARLEKNAYCLSVVKSGTRMKETTLWEGYLIPTWWYVTPIFLAQRLSANAVLVGLTPYKVFDAESSFAPSPDDAKDLLYYVPQISGDRWYVMSMEVSGGPQPTLEALCQMVRDAGMLCYNPTYGSGTIFYSPGDFRTDRGAPFVFVNSEGPSVTPQQLLKTGAFAAYAGQGRSVLLQFHSAQWLDSTKGQFTVNANAFLHNVEGAAGGTVRGAGNIVEAGGKFVAMAGDAAAGLGDLADQARRSGSLVVYVLGIAAMGVVGWMAWKWWKRGRPQSYYSPYRQPPPQYPRTPGPHAPAAPADRREAPEEDYDDSDISWDD